MSLFNPRKPGQFTHNPIYSDPRKEEAQRREKSASADADEEKYIPRTDIREAFVKSSSRLRHKRSVFGRIFRIGVILSVLTALAAVIYFLYPEHF